MTEHCFLVYGLTINFLDDIIRLCFTKVYDFFTDRFPKDFFCSSFAAVLNFLSFQITKRISVFWIILEGLNMNSKKDSLSYSNKVKMHAFFCRTFFRRILCLRTRFVLNKALACTAASSRSARNFRKVHRNLCLSTLDLWKSCANHPNECFPRFARVRRCAQGPRVAYRLSVHHSCRCHRSC